MATTVDDQMLESYLRDNLTPGARRRVERALRDRAELCRRLDELKTEIETLDAVRDARSNRLSDREEARITSEISEKLNLTMHTPQA